MKKNLLITLFFSFAQRADYYPYVGTYTRKTSELNAKIGQLTPGNPPSTAVTPSSGPRHFTFHPNSNFACLIQEMGSTITGFAYKNGRLTPFRTVNNLPDDYTGRK